MEQLMLIATIMAGVSPLIVLFVIAIRRFTRVEDEVKHQGQCQKTMAKIVIRIGRKINVMDKEIKELEGMQ